MSSLKNRYSISLLLITLTFSLPAHAGIQWERFVSHEKMPPSPGKYHDEEVESGQRRALSILTRDEKIALGMKAEQLDQLTFANFRHNKIFYVATIPGIKVDASNRVVSTDNVVAKVGYSEKHWAANIRKATRSVEAHSELVFTLNPGHEIQLIANQNTRTPLRTIKVLKDPVILSVEAVRSAEKPDASFFPDALGPNFAVVHRIVSDHERDLQHRDDPDRQIDSDKLSFEGVKSKPFAGSEARAKVLPNPMDALLVTAILRSELRGRKETYGVATKNCTNSLFQLMDEVLIYKNPINKAEIKKGIVKFLKTDLPGIIEFMEAQQKLADAEKVQLDAITKTMLVRLKEIDSKKLDESQISESAFSSLPALIKPHLRARGLLK